MNTNETLTPERIMQFAWGYAPTLIIEAAVRTGVFDQLDPGPLSLPELVRQTGASARGVTAILNALVGLKLLARVDERYALKRMDVLATALRASMTVHDLAELELAYAPPFGSAKDPVNLAGMAAQNVLDGSVSLRSGMKCPPSIRLAC